MKQLRHFFMLGMAAVLLASCGASMKVSIDYDRTADFSKYKTFGIYRLPNDQIAVSQLNKDRIYAAIRTSLAAKGMQESANPDLWINAVAVITTRQSHSSTTTGMGGMGMMGMGGFHRPYMWGGPMMMGGPMITHTQHHVTTYKDGTLIIDMIDARTNSLVWSGIGEREIDKKFTREPDQKTMKYVNQLLSTFPPGGLVHHEMVVKD